VLEVFWRQAAWVIKIKSVLAPKGAIHLLNENIRYDIMLSVVYVVPFLLIVTN
jgi:hypothetical protein